MHYALAARQFKVDEIGVRAGGVDTPARRQRSLGAVRPKQRTPGPNHVVARETLLGANLAGSPGRPYTPSQSSSRVQIATRKRLLASHFAHSKMRTS